MFTLLQGKKKSENVYLLTRASRKWPLNSTTFESVDSENGDSLLAKVFAGRQSFYNMIRCWEGTFPRTYRKHRHIFQTTFQWLSDPLPVSYLKAQARLLQNTDRVHKVNHQKNIKQRKEGRSSGALACQMDSWRAQTETDH